MKKAKCWLVHSLWIAQSHIDFGCFFFFLQTIYNLLGLADWDYANVSNFWKDCFFNFITCLSKCKVHTHNSKAYTNIYMYIVYTKIELICRTKSFNMEKKKQKSRQNNRKSTYLIKIHRKWCFLLFISFNFCLLENDEINTVEIELNILKCFVFLQNNNFIYEMNNLSCEHMLHSEFEMCETLMVLYQMKSHSKTNSFLHSISIRFLYTVN